jgi:hypothetical protein
MPRSSLLGLAVVILAVAAAGCGGGDEGPSAEEQWAGEICTSIASWRTEVEAITRNTADALTQSGATREDLENGIQDGLDATKELTDELRASVPPDTPEGAQAKSEVNAFLDDVRGADDRVRTALADLPEGASLAQVVTQLAGLATSLQSTLEGGRALVEDLTDLGGDLKDAFENASSCKELREASDNS